MTATEPASQSAIEDAAGWPYLGPVDGPDRVQHLVAGRAMPDLDLLTSAGARINLSQVRGRALLAVYPWTGAPGKDAPPAWDDIPAAHGSTAQLEGLRDHALEFAARGITIYALSGQDADWHCELIARLRLPFPVLGDTAGALHGALGLPTFATGGVTYFGRMGLLIEDGRIAAAVYPIFPPPAFAKLMLHRADKVWSKAAN